MSGFFTIAGIVVTVIGVVAIAIVSGVYVAVRFFGVIVTFGFIKEQQDDTREED